jgi:hypothetical protein
MEAKYWRCPKCGDDNWMGCPATDCPGKIKRRKAGIQVKWLIAAGLALLAVGKFSDLIQGPGTANAVSGKTDKVSPKEDVDEPISPLEDTGEISRTKSVPDLTDEKTTASTDLQSAEVPRKASAPDPSVLSGAVASALETGKSVAWDAGDATGYVEVSAPAAITDGECKTIRVGQISAVWCRQSGGKWNLSH